MEVVVRQFTGRPSIRHSGCSDALLQNHVVAGLLNSAALSYHNDRRAADDNSGNQHRYTVYDIIGPILSQSPPDALYAEPVSIEKNLYGSSEL